MKVTGSRVAVLGGSISGCAAAVALTRASCDVTVFERSKGVLQERGTGISTPPDLRDELIRSGYLPDDYPYVEYTKKLWVHADGTPRGRLIWTQRATSVMNNWGVLWRCLRERVPDACYHEGVTVNAFERSSSGVRISSSDGASREFDILIGADGYRSTVRSAINPKTELKYSGYVAWRGSYPESRIHDRSVIDWQDAVNGWSMLVFEGGNASFVTIPSPDGRVTPGERHVNWIIYGPQPAGHDFTSPASIPPGSVDAGLYKQFDRLLTDYFPDDFAALARYNSQAEVSIQPIYDEMVAAYADRQVLLIGDAGAVTRPHTGSGATKALEDALVLERLARTCDTWDDVLTGYNTERLAASNMVVAIGRRLAQAQIEQPPDDWLNMTEADFQEWTKTILAGDSLYIWANVDEA